jgi:hypothetical protein
LSLPPIAAARALSATLSARRSSPHLVRRCGVSRYSPRISRRISDRLPVRHRLPISPDPGYAPISRSEAVKEAVKADTLALVAFEVGLFGWMSLVAYVLLPLPLTANSVVFWLMMQIGMVLGLLATYPVNSLLIRRGSNGECESRFCTSV